MRALLLAAPLLIAAGDPATIPAPIKAMLDAAMASGSEGDVATIVKYARTAAPESADSIAKIATDWRTQRRLANQQKIRDAAFLDLVKGHVELGGYINTGNSNNVGLSGALELRREGIEWRHKLRLQADYQKSLGVVTREHYLAAYEPNWKFDDRAYMYGSAQFESDRLLGYYTRYSTSVGTGYSAIKQRGLTLDLELGPAFRHTRFTDQHIESNVAARGSVDFDWKVTPGISLHQNASAYLQSANSTVSSKSALQARVMGPLSAQLSYTLQYESMPPIGRQTTDTTSRAALVVDF